MSSQGVLAALGGKGACVPHCLSCDANTRRCLSCTDSYYWVEYNCLSDCSNAGNRVYAGTDSVGAYLADNRYCSGETLAMHSNPAIVSSRHFRSDRGHSYIVVNSHHLRWSHCFVLQSAPFSLKIMLNRKKGREWNGAQRYKSSIILLPH